MSRKFRVGILGCGTIGSQLAAILDKKYRSHCRLTAFYDLRKEKAAEFARRWGGSSSSGLEALVRRSDFIIEAASQKAVGPLLRKALRRGKTVLVMSVGALVADPSLVRLASAGTGCVYIPSGALAGVDGVLSSSVGRVRRAVLTTKKPPQALAGAPLPGLKKILSTPLKKEVLVFRGTASRAVRAFPQNINVAAVLSLAGIGARKTEVRIYASPGLKRNIHQIEIEGDAGRIFALTENVPSPGNPKTSHLAALSPAALLKKIFSPLKIGT
ncbi:MAG: DUF108 domain-containing protein [Candidatus Omnitrophica bacterium]|nr:DUF108 domain-containing protein [Candidatus Omnitrophota bacterium]